MFTIPVNSEAGEWLLADILAPNTYKISFDVRKDGVAVKRNEGMWSPTLSLEEK